MNQLHKNFGMIVMEMDLVVEMLWIYVKIKFQAEDLGVSPASEVMSRFESFGLPTYAILRITPSDGSAEDESNN